MTVRIKLIHTKNLEWGLAHSNYSKKKKNLWTRNEMAESNILSHLVWWYMKLSQLSSELHTSESSVLRTHGGFSPLPAVLTASPILSCCLVTASQAGVDRLSFLLWTGTSTAEKIIDHRLADIKIPRCQWQRPFPRNPSWSISGLPPCRAGLPPLRRWFDNTFSQSPDSSRRKLVCFHPNSQSTQQASADTQPSLDAS